MTKYPAFIVMTIHIFRDSVSTTITIQFHILCAAFYGPDRSVSRVTAETVLPAQISRNPRIEVKTSRDRASNRTI